MSKDLDVIKRIVDAFERSDWTEIDVRAGSLRVHLSTQPQTAGDSAADSAPAVIPVRGGVGDEMDAIDPSLGDPSFAAAVGASTKAPEIPPGSHVVVSPSPGICWRSPQPGAPPFAEVGDIVEPATTMCIIEVMKLMSQVKSGAAGTVVGVFVENGVRVDQGEALFAVEPHQSS